MVTCPRRKLHLQLNKYFQQEMDYRILQNARGLICKDLFKEKKLIAKDFMQNTLQMSWNAKARYQNKDGTSDETLK